jgi:hypothetical protein
MQTRTLLNHCHPLKSFVYTKCRLELRGDHLQTGAPQSRACTDLNAVLSSCRTGFLGIPRSLCLLSSHAPEYGKRDLQPQSDTTI